MRGAQKDTAAGWCRFARHWQSCLQASRSSSLKGQVKVWQFFFSSTARSCLLMPSSSLLMSS